MDSAASTTCTTLTHQPHAADLKNEALADELTTLAGHLNAAGYRFLKLLSECRARKVPRGPRIGRLAAAE